MAELSENGNQAISGDRRHSGGVERHAQTIIQVIIVALLLWVGQSTVQTREDIVALRVNDQNRSAMMAAMQNEIISIRTNASTASAAATAAALAASNAAALLAERNRNLK